MLRNFKFVILALSLSVSGLVAQNLTTSDAVKHVGERATVCGKIASEHTSEQSRGKPTFINLDRAYPDQVFTVVVWDNDRANVGPLPKNGDICVTGKIALYHGIPQIALDQAKDWQRQNRTSAPQAQLSNDRHYTNSDGKSIHSPAYSNSGVPSGATAVCMDGTYSFSQHRQGTCSRHGGVSRWL